MIAVPEGQELPIVREADGRLVMEGEWPLSICVDGRFLDLVTRGQARPGAVRVRGHVEPVAGSITRTVWDAITFVCANGTATYDFIDQDGDDRARDIWRGVRRDIVDNVMASLSDG